MKPQVLTHLKKVQIETFAKTYTGSLLGYHITTIQDADTIHKTSEAKFSKTSESPPYESKNI